MAFLRVQGSSSSVSRCTYDVFLSFRGKDTRKNFTDHLYLALVQAGLHTFRDDDEIERGEHIESELQKAIEQSRISIIVLSKTYADSIWCLDELVKILHCKKTFQQEVVPVFYDVDPSQVRNQLGSFGEAFSRHEGRFGVEKVKRWREALKDVSELAGMVLQNQFDGHESKFIQKIVQEVGNKLKRATVLSVGPYVVGLESRVREINSWLKDGSVQGNFVRTMYDGLTDVKNVVIYGIGGIGKTTIAKTVYNLNLENFEAKSFLANVREVSAQPNGFIQLQKQFLSDILKGRKEEIYNTDEGIYAIEEATCCKRVLLVLDDVDEVDQIHKILGWRQWFHSGSTIIVTTRHKEVLKSSTKRWKFFKIKTLDNDESLELFSWHAFGQEHPIKDYLQLSKRVLHHCGGLPLALQILGSSLSGRSVDAWESALKKLEAITDSQIQKVLRISYESLLDDHDKNLFLDMACFFVGKDRDYSVKILDECGFYTTVGIQNLIDRCLLTIDKDDNKIKMHQLIQDMGREIVRQESPKDPGKRSRLCFHMDSFNVLRELTGTETIEGIILDLHKLDEIKLASAISAENNANHGDTEQYYKVEKGNLSTRHFFRNPLKASSARSGTVSLNEADLKTEAFAKMQRLRLLQLNYVQLNGSYENLPRTLRWLCWHGFALKTIPKNFILENLVALDMCNSSLEKIWKGKRFLGSLKILNVSHSHSLRKTPNFYGLPNLEILKLKDCISLAEVHKSIGNLKRLVFLNLKGCKNLRKLPRELSMANCLEKLVLSGCSKLDEFPELKNMEHLTVFHADQSMDLSKTVNQSFFRSPSRNQANFALASLPKTLVSLSLANCELTDSAIPGDFSVLLSLRELNLSGNLISSLPESIKGLNMLQSLQLDRCTRLQSLPELPTSLKDLVAKDCTSLQRIENLPNLLQSLHLEFFGCEKLVEVKGLFKLEPVENIDQQMVNDLGLFKLGSTTNIAITLANNMTYTERKSHVQGLYECGIFSIFLPGSAVPDWFSHKSNKSSICFDVPPHKIQGLNVCIVYEIMNFVHHGFGDVHYLKIANTTKGVKWTYCPTFYAIPSKNERMLWLSHMKFGNQFRGGDQVTLSVTMATDFLLKQCGVQFVYKDEEVPEEEEEGTLTCRTRVGAHLLCHHRFVSHRGGERLSGFDICFMGSANCWPIIGVSRPRLDSLWAPPKVVKEEKGATVLELNFDSDSDTNDIADDDQEPVALSSGDCLAYV